MIKEYLTKIAGTTSRGRCHARRAITGISLISSNRFARKLGKRISRLRRCRRRPKPETPIFVCGTESKKSSDTWKTKKQPKNLDDIEDSEQLKRYRSTFPKRENLILTDFYHFRLYRNGILIDTVLVARPFIAKKLQTTPPVENEEKFITLLEKFFVFFFTERSYR